MSEREKILEEIIADYNLAIAEFENASLVYDAIKDLNDSKREEALIIWLANVGELAFKYVMRLEQINRRSYSTYVAYKNEEFVDDRTQERKHIRDFADLAHIIPRSNFASQCSDIINFQGKEIGHNFYYLYLVINHLFPNQVNNLNSIINFKKKSEKVLKSDLPEDLKNQFSIFTNKTIDNMSLTEEQRRTLEFINNIVLSTSGDAFVTLRYFDNNPNKKTYNLDDIYHLIENIITYVKAIHISNDDINCDIENAYVKMKIIEQCEKFGKTPEFINSVFSHSRLTREFDIQEAILLYTALSEEEIIALLDDSNISNKDLYLLIRNNINHTEYDYFSSKGIKNPTDMILMKENDDKVLSSTLEGDDFKLQKYFPASLVSKLNSVPNIKAILVNNFEILQDIITPSNMKLFEKIISIPDIDKTPEIIYGMDYAQIMIAKRFAPEGSYDDETIINNIKNNINLFKETPIVYKKIPAMLDGQNSKEVLDLLIDLGIDINKIDLIDGTVFCIPSGIMKMIVEYAKSNSIVLVNDGILSDTWRSYVNRILLQNTITIGNNANRPLPLRRRPNFFKTDEELQLNELNSSEYYSNVSRSFK